LTEGDDETGVEERTLDGPGCIVNKYAERAVKLHTHVEAKSDEETSPDTSVLE
jgi:hypothetical protein